MISIAKPIIAEEEIRAVNEVLQSGNLAQGPKVAELEEVFAQYCGTKYAVAVNSGTAAIHAALFAAGVKEGDEVITTPFSFIATINPILMLGARPVLVDIEPATFNIDVSKIEQAITDKTKAIIPVDLYGQPINYDELQKIADTHNLKIIEDSCQSIGAEYKGKKTGSLGDLGCFSLYATKNIMCGEGGVVTTDSTEYVKAMKSFRQHGMSETYEYDYLGFNYRMSDLHAAIAVEQVKKIDIFSEKRVANAHKLSELLVNIKGIELPQVSNDRTHVYHQYTIRVANDAKVGRDETIDQLRAGGVGAGVYYPKPLHFYSHISKLGYSKGDFPNAEAAAEQVISLPVHPGLTNEDVDTIAETLKAIHA